MPSSSDTQGRYTLQRNLCLACHSDKKNNNNTDAFIIIMIMITSQKCSYYTGFSHICSGITWCSPAMWANGIMPKPLPYSIAHAQMTQAQWQGTKPAHVAVLLGVQPSFIHLHPCTTYAIYLCLFWHGAFFREPPASMHPSIYPPCVSSTTESS